MDLYQLHQVIKFRMWKWKVDKAGIWGKTLRRGDRISGDNNHNERVHVGTKFFWKLKRLSIERFLKTAE